jgi:hypothetical protein
VPCLASSLGTGYSGNIMKWLVFVLVLINAVRLRGVLRLSAAIDGKLAPVHAAMGLGTAYILAERRCPGHGQALIGTA